MSKRNLPILNFKYGLMTSLEKQSVPRGAATANLNWITQGTKIELRRGYNLLGTTANTGLGKITGLRTAKKPNGDDIVYRTRKRKIEYLDTTTDDWVEVGTNAMPAAVTATDSLGEDISIEPYQNPTGTQVWFNSPNCGPIKIMTANPGSYTEMYVLGTNYKGYMRIKNGRMYVWNRAGNPGNRTDLFASHLDVKADSDYTQVVAEVIAGASGTLAFKAGGARRICFQVVFTVTSGGQVFTDNGDGTLTGSLGGSGTINYTTGAYTGVGAGTCTYRWADDSAAAATPPTTASAGIANFNFSATRVATEGFILPQATGGDFKNLASLNGIEYCLHERATWAVSVSSDDADVTNVVYRAKAGIPNHRAMVESADGIYYIDDTDSNDVHFRILTLDTQSSEVLPKSISKQFKLSDVKVGVNLSGYLFDKGAAIEFGDLVLFACRTSDSSTNNRVFVYNKVNKAHDILDYYVSCFEVYNGTLIAGDSVSDNVYTLLSGYDDDDSTIANYWESSLDNLDYDGQKRVVEITMDGEIGPEQAIKVLMAPDRGSFVEVRSSSDQEESILVSSAYTETVVADNYSELNGSGSYFAMPDLSNARFTERVGQSFTPSETVFLTSCKFSLKKNDSPNADMYAKIYLTSGINGTNAKPTGDPIAVSSPINSSTLTSSFALVEFTFSNNIELLAGTTYAVVIEHIEDFGSDAVYVQYDGSSPTHQGNSFISDQPLTEITWQTYSSRDVIFYVYGTKTNPAVYRSAHAIEGGGDYVDRSQRVNVGPLTMGRGELGGGGDGIEAYHYRRTFRIAIDKFEYVQFRFEATGLGYASVTEFTFEDIRLKWGRTINRYRVGR
jgi:hypothetical protein